MAAKGLLQRLFRSHQQDTSDMAGDETDSLAFGSLATADGAVSSELNIRQDKPAQKRKALVRNSWVCAGPPATLGDEEPNCGSFFWKLRPADMPSAPAAAGKQVRTPYHPLPLH
jgi:hypothetical protein